MTNDAPAQAMREALRKAREYLAGSNPLRSSSGHKNADLRDEIDAALSQPPTVGAEDEAVAWMDDGSTRAGSHGTAYRVVTAETKADMPAAAAAAYTTPLYLRPAPAADGQRVKALRWEDAALMVSHGWMTVRMAKTPFGIYAVDKRVEMLRVTLCGQVLASCLPRSLDEAKAAAQSDFEQRIRASLATDKEG